MSYPSYIRDKDSRLDYIWDWTAWLTGSETITAVTWVLETGIVNDHTSATTTSATIWLTGGTAGTTYLVTCRISTSAGRIDDRSAKIKVQER